MNNLKSLGVWVIVLAIIIIFMIVIFNGGPEWNGKYVSNVDGYTVVTLKETEDGFGFYIKGSKFGQTFGINRDDAKIEGNTGVYRAESFGEEYELEFSFDGDNLVIKALTNNMKILEGTYVLADEATFDEIVYSNEEYGSEIYKYKDVDLTVTKGVNDTIVAEFDGSDELGNFYLGTSELELKNGIAKYEDDTFGDVEKLRMEFIGSAVNVVASSTDEESLYNRVNGEYIYDSKKKENFSEIKREVNSIEISVGVTMGL